MVCFLTGESSRMLLVLLLVVVVVVVVGGGGIFTQGVVFAVLRYKHLRKFKSARSICHFAGEWREGLNVDVQTKKEVIIWFKQSNSKPFIVSSN